MKWDLKSIITIILVIMLAISTLFLEVSKVCGWISVDDPTTEKMVLLFSNAITMILTFYFTKKKDGDT